MEELTPEPSTPVVPFHKSHHSFFILVFIICALGAGATLLASWTKAEAEIDWLSIPREEIKASEVVTVPREKTPKQVVKGVYLTAYSANNPKKIDEIIKLLDATELNAVVIDIKDYSGPVLYDSQVPLVKKLKTKEARIKDVPGLLKKLHEHGVYVIARQTVFQDPALAAAKPEWAVKNESGAIWRDNKGLAWVDSTRREVWNYNIAIAKEAIGLGFDEINFDYVRFPSDGDIKSMRFSSLLNTKRETMAEFYKTLGEELKNEPAWISLDLFGLTMEATSTFDLNIGQRIVDAVDNVDYISPMMYPSHYPPGHLGLSNPADHPAEVFAYGMKLGEPKFVGKRAEVRPWIQAFNLGAVYDGAKIRAQIDEIEKVPNAGWLMWNASNRYTSAGLKSE